MRNREIIIFATKTFLIRKWSPQKIRFLRHISSQFGWNGVNVQNPPRIPSKIPILLPPPKVPFGAFYDSPVWNSTLYTFLWRFLVWKVTFQEWGNNSDEMVSKFKILPRIPSKIAIPLPPPKVPFGPFSDSPVWNPTLYTFCEDFLCEKSLFKNGGI